MTVKVCVILLLVLLFVLIYFRLFLIIFFPGGARWYFTKALISQYLKPSTENPVQCWKKKGIFDHMCCFKKKRQYAQMCQDI